MTSNAAAEAAAILVPAPVPESILSSIDKAVNREEGKKIEEQEVVENSDINVKAETVIQDMPPLLKKEENDGDDDNNEGKKVEDEDEDGEPTTLCDLMEALNEIDTPGSSCAAGPASCLPSVPGLHFKGVGDIPLPISDAQAKALADVAEQAPHGKGLETIVDTSVRNTLHVDPSRVTLNNPLWGPSLLKLVRQAAEALGVSPDLVRAELYKLLLYETGGFFKKHRDTEKAKGMFATLVVQLPSNFTGGSFLVSHGGKSEAFTMGAGSDAAYGCHFVCHYADCEHEIMKVESGHRLALVYSLCYTGPSWSSPSAAKLGNDRLAVMLKGLPPHESLFVIPLGHQYTTASLARLGAGALKGSDRAKQSALESAGKGAWKTVIAKVERTDTESGDGGCYQLGGCGYYEDFDVCDVERGCEILSDAYFADGSDASCHTSSMLKHINFESVEEEGGMIMVSSDEMGEDGADFWGEGNSGSVEYTGNEGATRETIFSTYILIVYSEESEFERMCATNFSNVASYILKEKSLDLFQRLLAYMKQKKPPISNGDCINLLQVMKSIETADSEKIAAFKTIVDALSGNVSNVPSTLLADTFISFAEQFGWASAMDPIMAYASTLKNRESLCTSDFVLCMSFLLMMQTFSSSDGFVTIMKRAIGNFESQKMIQTSQLSYRYGYGGMQTVSNTLATMCRSYPREKTLPVVNACISRLRSDFGTNVNNLVEVVNLLKMLRSFNNSEDVMRWFQGVVDDFVAMVEKLPVTGSSSTQHAYGRSPIDILSSNNADELFRCLFEFGGSQDIKRVEQWAMKAHLERILKLQVIVNRVVKVTPASTFRDAAATDAFVHAVKGRGKELQLRDLYACYQKLLPATRTAPPVFTWSMPHAITSCPLLTEFLRSPRSGPERITVGGGISNSRRLANGYNRPLEQGYSAQIQSTSNTGKNAAIIVVKTRALYEAQTSRYTMNLAELTKVAEKIRSLGGSIPLPSLTVSSANAVVSNSTAQRAAGCKSNPAKKPRMEIIEID